MDGRKTRRSALTEVTSSLPVLELNMVVTAPLMVSMFSVSSNLTISPPLSCVDDVVLCVICAIPGKEELKQISLVDKRLRERSLPLLLRRVCIQFVYREDVWKLAADAIAIMLTSMAFDVIVGNTRFLDIRISDDQSEDSKLSGLPSRLAELLSAPFHQLHTLVFVIDEQETQIFDDNFRKAGIELPTVISLMVGAYSDFMVPLCPNVERVATYGQE
ncbi:uncharacterized protein BT62DRAFT_1008048 [Guyanagaster necrorhizus]|uniref:Uncharacterized protein n=1 Tax=Guyanagaster necrorhizus TaxID=856835 RepID=A0A9P7VPT8_9AGAR|nr:uncharacterized protein BT62DRAFT_1008048 [Guyanagaster necrorhizus MCA 3950]KAG7444387.1 hypothetical protein BT62DRAFT_1008048 [Guyanagaster necrorhizus MCA 3950]